MLSQPSATGAAKYTPPLPDARVRRDAPEPKTTRRPLSVIGTVVRVVLPELVTSTSNTTVSLDHRVAAHRLHQPLVDADARRAHDHLRIVVVRRATTGTTPPGIGVPFGCDGVPVAVPTFVVFWLTVAVFVHVCDAPGANGPATCR